MLQGECICQCTPHSSGTSCKYLNTNLTGRVYIYLSQEKKITTFSTAFVFAEAMFLMKVAVQEVNLRYRPAARFKHSSSGTSK